MNADEIVRALAKVYTVDTDQAELIWLVQEAKKYVEANPKEWEPMMRSWQSRKDEL